MVGASAHPMSRMVALTLVKKNHKLDSITVERETYATDLSDAGDHRAERILPLGWRTPGQERDEKVSVNAVAQLQRLSEEINHIRTVAEV